MPRAFWRRPIWAGVVAVLVLVPGIIALTRSDLFHATPQPIQTADGDEAKTIGLIRSGRRALAEGQFLKSGEFFREAVSRSRQAAESRPAVLRQAEQLELEASILNDLAGDSIPEMLGQYRGVGDPIWRERFQNHSILLDAPVQRTRDGYRVDYEMMLGDLPIHLHWGEQAQLQRLSLGEWRRLLFGFRLGEVKQTRGEWVLEVQPNSVVLMTDSAGFRTLSVPIDGEMQNLLAEQARLMNLP